MRILLRTRLAIVLLLLFTLTIAAESKADTPERIVSKRIRILSHEQYESLRDQWKAYTRSHPKDPVGWTELAKAARYAGEPCDDFLRYVRKAVELDPKYADAHATLGANSCAMYCPSQSEDPSFAISELELALKLDPTVGEAHYSLWPLKLSKGDRAGAAKHLRALVEHAHIPEMLLDMAYNMLVAVEQDAIILTNGDNDTYPPLALQAARGIRTDVAIMNLSLLNTEWYQEEMRRGPHNVPLPPPESESQRAKSKKSKGELPAARAVRGLMENLEKGGWKRPLYAAITLNFDRVDLPNELSLEGVVYRVLPKRKGEDGYEIDSARIAKNMRENYRLESATSLGFDWEYYSALRRMSANYVAIYSHLASGLAEGGDISGARDAMRKALGLCEFHGKKEMGRGVAESWSEWDGQSQEPKKWIRKFSK